MTAVLGLLACDRRWLPKYKTPLRLQVNRAFVHVAKQFLAGIPQLVVVFQPLSFQPQGLRHALLCAVSMGCRLRWWFGA